MARPSIASLWPARPAGGAHQEARAWRTRQGRRVAQAWGPKARSAGKRAIRAAFLLVTFLWPDKEKSPRAQGRSHPQLDFEIARKARETFKTWIPAFAGMTTVWEAESPTICF